MEPNTQTFEQATPPQEQSGTTQPSCKLGGIRHYIGKMLDVYGNNFVSFLVVSVIPIIAIYLLLFVVGGAFAFSLLAGKISPSATLSIPAFTLTHLALLVVGFVVFFLISILSNLTLLYLIKERENKLGLGACFQKALSNFGANIVISLLLLVIVAAGMIFFIIPGIIFAMWFGFSLYILVDENKKGMDALRRSKEIISGYIGAYFGRIILFGVLIGIVNSIFSFIISLLPFGDIISSFLAAILTPASLIFSFLIYEDIKKLKESGCTKSPKELKYTLIASLIIIIFFVGLLALFAAQIILPILLLRSGTSGGYQKSMRYQIIGDLSMLRAGAEMYYDSNNFSYAGLEGSYDVQERRQSIIDAGGSSFAVSVSPDGQKYCIQAKISAKEGYYCVDSMGSSISGQCLSGFSCQ